MMPRTYTYCGKINPDDALACDEGQWDGCGGTLSIKIVGTAAERLKYSRRGYPALIVVQPAKLRPILECTRQPGKTLRQFQRDVEAVKREIGLAMLPALQEALRQWGG